MQKEQKKSTGPFQATATFRKLEGASEACQFQVPWEGRGSILQGKDFLNKTSHPNIFLVGTRMNPLELEGSSIHRLVYSGTSV